MSFSTLSIARPMSRTRTGEPLRYATMSGPYAEAAVSWPVARTVNAVFAPQSVPVGRLTFAAATAAADLVDADAARRQRVRVELDAHRVLLRAEDLDLRDAASPSKCAGR